MTNRKLYFKASDTSRLRNWLGLHTRDSTRMGRYARLLQQEIDDGKVVPDEALPKGTVSLYTRVRIVSQGETGAYTLVAPLESDLARGALAVTTPLGMAIMGYREGDRISWGPPGYEVETAIEKVWDGLPPATVRRTRPKVVHFSG